MAVDLAALAVRRQMAERGGHVFVERDDTRRVSVCGRCLAVVSDLDLANRTFQPCRGDQVDAVRAALASSR